MTTATWDSFPADVTLPDGSKHQGVRVILTDAGMLIVYGQMGDTVTQVFAAAVHGAPVLKSPYAPRYDSESSIPTDQGIVTALRGAGCGCGSVLKHANLANLGVPA
jgi:hypothetical protein